MKNNPKKVVISGYYGFNNFGDEAVLSVLINFLKLENIEDITVISKNPENTRKTYQTEAVYTFDILKIFLNILKSDILFSGGGSLLQDVTSLKSLVYYLFIITLAIFFRKKVIIFAQGIGPIKNQFFGQITKNLLKKCTFVTVRDEKSFELLKKWGIPAHLVCDPVWELRVFEKVSDNAIGVQLRKWETLTDEKIESLAKAIASNFSDKEVCIYEFQEAQDKEACEKFENELKKQNPNIVVKIIINESIEMISKSFAHLDTIIAMRYHACLLGLKYGIKVLPVIYDPKVESLADEFGLTNRLYLDGEFKADEVTDSFKKAENNLKALPKFDFDLFREYLKKPFP